MKNTCSCEMTLDEAIEHALDVSKGNSSCAKQHAQLAHWLSEYRDLLLSQERLSHALNLVSNAREGLFLQNEEYLGTKF